jgi:uncharacterized delta-60 repeat protein
MARRPKWLVLLTTASAALVVLLGGGSALAGAADLDTTFNGTGRVTTPIGGSDDIATAAVVQPDGKLVLAGYTDSGGNQDVALVRYNPDGSLDTTFNGSGKVITPIGGGPDYAVALVLQPDGRLVAAGGSSNGSDVDFALVRYNPNGSLDTTFNSTGKVTTPIGGGEDIANAAVVQPDGKLVVAGHSANGPDYDFALARYNPNGSLDTTFNGTGKVITPFGGGLDKAQALVVQPDGKLLAAGYSHNGSNYDVALARYNANGSLDTTFNGTGKVTTPIGGDDYAFSLVLQPDGKAVAGITSGSNSDFALARYDPNGSLDTTFNGTGKVTTPIGSGNDAARALFLQPDGKLVLAGNSVIGSANDAAVARYNANGSLDTTFDGTGKVTAPIGGGDDIVTAALRQPDGKIVVAGYSHNGSNFDFGLARFGRGLQLASARSAPGSSLPLLGWDLGPNEAVDVYFDTTDVALVASDDAGSIHATVPIPAGAAIGTHWVTAVGRHSGIAFAASVAVGADWPMSRFDAEGTGVNSYEGALSPTAAAEIRLLWRTKLGTGGSRVTPASVGGTVYGVGPTGRAYALDGRTGGMLWQSPGAPPNGGSSPAVTAASVVVGSTNGHVYAWNVGDGHENWENAPGSVSAPPTLSGGAVYVGTDANQLWILDANTGVKLAGSTPFTAVGPIKGAPAVSDGLVYFGAGNKIYALDALTGALAWQQGPFAGANFVASPAIDSGEVFIGGQDGNLYVFDAADGSPLPVIPVGAAMTSSPAVENGVVYVGSADGKVHAYDEDDGTSLWSRGLGSSVTGSPAVANGVLAVTVSSGHKLYLLNADTGAKLRAGFSLRANPSSPIVVNGTIYVSSNGGLSAYGLPGGSAAPTAPPDPRTLLPDPSLPAP